MLKLRRRISNGKPAISCGQWLHLFQPNATRQPPMWQHNKTQQTTRDKQMNKQTSSGQWLHWFQPNATRQPPMWQHNKTQQTTRDKQMNKQTSSGQWLHWFQPNATRQPPMWQHNKSQLTNKQQQERNKCTNQQALANGFTGFNHMQPDNHPCDNTTKRNEQTNSNKRQTNEQTNKLRPMAAHVSTRQPPIWQHNTQISKN